MLREAPTEQPKPSLCAGSVPREQRAQALTRLRDFCSHLTLHKVTAPARERGAEPGVTQPGDVLRGTEGGWRRERRLLDCEAIFQTCEEPFLFFYIFFSIDFQTASIYQRMKEIDFKRKNPVHKKMRLKPLQALKTCKDTLVFYSFDLTIKDTRKGF